MSKSQGTGIVLLVVPQHLGANNAVKPTAYGGGLLLTLEIIHADFESNHSVAYRPSLGNTCGLSRFFRCYEVNFWLQKSEKFSLN